MAAISSVSSPHASNPSFPIKHTTAIPKTRFVSAAELLSVTLSTARITAKRLQATVFGAASIQDFLWQVEQESNLQPPVFEIIFLCPVVSTRMVEDFKNSALLPYDVQTCLGTTIRVGVTVGVAGA